jgi:hypothetical protein
MKPSAYILLGLLAASTTGCDGYARVLYLQQPAMPKPPWSVASTTIEVSGDENVAGLVQDVAATLGLAYDSRLSGYAVADDDGGSFTMRASQEEDGRWVITLLDWPSSTRSQKSVDAEKAIRKVLASGTHRSARSSAG